MRAEVRRAYRCPCDGLSHRQAGRTVSRRAAAVDGQLAAIEAATGDRPEHCPWWSFHDPDVAAVLRCYDAIAGDDRSDELLRQLWGEDPPWWLVLGLAHYRRVLGSVRAESRRQEREERERARKRKLPQLPPGFEAEFVQRG